MPPRRSARAATTTANSQDTQPVDTKPADADTQIEEDDKPVVRRSSRKVTAKPAADAAPASTATKAKPRKARKGTTAAQDTGSQDVSAPAQAADDAKPGKKRASPSGQSEDEAVVKPKSKKAKKSAPTQTEDETSNKEDAKMVRILRIFEIFY